MPGEWYSPTQPFPTKPPAYARQAVTMDDLIDFTPELHAKALEMVKILQDGSDVHASRRSARLAARTPR